jgi:deoxyribonuclease-1
MPAVVVFLSTLLFASVFSFSLVIPGSAIAQDDVPHSISSFRQAKKLAAKVYADHRESFYCGCNFNKKKLVDAESCGYSPRKSAKRGKRIEWEHIVPAHAFGHSRQCWREPSAFAACHRNNGKILSGRKCCNKVDPVFRAMAADLYNLAPAVGELNGDRANFSFGMLNKERRAYGSCDFEVDFKRRTAEPPPEVRGDIARTYFYFQQTYGLRISKKQRRLFEIWNRNDPVDRWEHTRALRIEKIQGNQQHFVNPGLATNQHNY